MEWTLAVGFLLLWAWAAQWSLRTLWPRYEGRPVALAFLVLGAVLAVHILVVVAWTGEDELPRSGTP